MAMRRNFMLTAPAGVAAMAIAGTAPPAGAEDPKTIDFLLVQTAKGMTFDAATNTLRLGGVSPVTLFFSDRPERIAGNMRTTAFVPFWSRGTDSFQKDPPNADVSFFAGDAMQQAVVVLREPVLEGDVLRYAVQPIQGRLPPSASDVSVFIDIIGMPWTPLSYAGVARRSYRRAYWR
jgi:hypothetical protein